jgi:hypothetical protein
MGPRRILEILIAADGPVSVRSLVDASVHRPTRSTRWVGSFRNENGRQVWRTTGLRNREAALVLATEWETEARRRRAARGALPRRPTMRVRPGSLGLTQKEVALLMGLSERTVRSTEKQALAKLRDALQDLWREWETGEIKEVALVARSDRALSRAEVAALYALARTPDERQALRKLFAMAQGQYP